MPPGKTKRTVSTVQAESRGDVGTLGGARGQWGGSRGQSGGRGSDPLWKRQQDSGCSCPARGLSVPFLSPGPSRAGAPPLWKLARSFPVTGLQPLSSLRLHAHGEGELVITLESWEVTRASRRVEEGLSRSLSGGGGKPSCPSPSAGVLAWRIPGTGEPGGLLSMGSHRVGHSGALQDIIPNLFPGTSTSPTGPRLGDLQAPQKNA